MNTRNAVYPANYWNPYSLPGTNQLMWSNSSNAGRVRFFQGPINFTGRIQTPVSRGQHTKVGGQVYNFLPGNRGRMWTK